jgi:hypothetical protein
MDGILPRTSRVQCRIQYRIRWRLLIDPLVLGVDLTDKVTDFVSSLALFVDPIMYADLSRIGMSTLTGE